ncbi:hypothetical protein J5N97_026007 [Dioscorea zingiberensis]|uniref:Non-specific serine/threonine protein kinase n=1 Tax=Dioscorea zingiberensis TaxID=325984 RepID=A0A9D5C2M2_9LILI|nr:hypothetical protein J5N97_026007 [Dioscorea zingiberensis]
MASGLHLLLWLSISSPFLVHHPQAVPDFSLPDFNSTAFPSSLWLNTLPASTPERTYTDGSLIRPILIQSQAFNYTMLRSGLGFTCCFICRDDCNGFIFSIVIVEMISLGSNAQRPNPKPVQVVWSANRNKPVKEGATLELTMDGDLVLTDVDGSISWSSGTAGKSVARMELGNNGSLGLFDSRGVVIWESFEYPSDTLMQGQRLVDDQRLTASVSRSNFTEGPLYMIFNSAMLAAYIQSHPPVRYYSRGFMHVFSVDAHCDQTCYLGLINGSLELHFSPSSITRIPLPKAHSVQFLRLDSDGHLRLYEYNGFLSWKVVADLFSDSLDDCDYPTVCGSYGICTKDQCSCPNGVDNYFTSLKADPKLGCPAVTELSCDESQLHQFMTLYGVSYFNLGRRVLSGVDAESCKVACLSNCSCKAAFLQYKSNVSSGKCYLSFHEVFSLLGSPKSEFYNYTTFLKVQRPNHLNGSEYVERNRSRVSSKNNARLLVVVVLGSVAVAISISLIIIVYKRALFLRKKPTINVNVDRVDSEENHHFDHVLKLPARFLYKDIVSATNNFSIELGSGGSGSVFEGTLVDGKKVAVKRIERILQGKKQFLAEIETIGSTHHVNLGQDDIKVKKHMEQRWS